MRPPGLASAAARSSSAACCLRRSASAPGRTRHLASGLRRQVPVPVHGASISTQVGAAIEVAEHVSLAARRADLDVARAGARDAFVDWQRLPLVDVGRIDLAAVVHRGGERQRLAAGAGGEIDHLLAGLGAGKQRRKLRAFVLDFDFALAEYRLGVNRRALGIGRQDECAGRPATIAPARRSDAQAWAALPRARL